MCGIAGILGLNGRPVDLPSLRSMCNTLVHRGPDDEGTFLAPPGAARIGLGHRRLAILDLGETGHQPMADESGRIQITYNGEIYNFRDLRRTLSVLGHRFRSRTDTEVILHAYEEWGEECVRRFNGMWAFAIWDGIRNRLFLSRDRFGVKPLYYLLSRDSFVFASEIKAILAVRPEESVPNRPHLAAFLTHGLTDHGEETFFQRIRSLPPGHSMIVTPEGTRLNRYWDLGTEVASEQESSRHQDGERPEDAFLSLLKDAVRLRLVSDVPLGSCLSGGLDSSAIVSLACRAVPGIPTFTSVFEDSSCDESSYAVEMEKRFSTRPHHVRPDVEAFAGLLSRMIWFQDEPGAAYGIFPQWKVMEEASRHVRVLLDGQGGDELLAGYQHFLPHYLRTIKDDPATDGETFRKARDLIGVLYGPGLAIPYSPEREDPHCRSAILTPELRSESPMPERDFTGPFPHHLDNVLYRALTRDVLPGLLHYQDRMSMAFSLESRVPFLDYRLVKYCFSLPYQAKIRQGMTKAVLRDAFLGILPESIRGRRDKMGFPAPLCRWLREDLRPLVCDTLLSRESLQRGILDAGTLRDRLQCHLQGSMDHTWEIWRWLSVEVWFRVFIDRQPEAVAERMETRA